MEMQPTRRQHNEFDWNREDCFFRNEALKFNLFIGVYNRAQAAARLADLEYCRHCLVRITRVIDRLRKTLEAACLHRNLTITGAKSDQGSAICVTRCLACQARIGAASLNLGI